MTALDRRRAGVLLHLTSLPGPGAVGRLGPAAEAFVEWLAEAGQSVWQILPLGPPGYGESPYDSHSSRAGNPLLISPQWLHEDGLLPAGDSASTDAPPFADRKGGDRVDFAAAAAAQRSILERAFSTFENQPAQRAALEEELAPEASWLDEWCLFAALKADHGGGPWPAWEPGLRDRRPGDLEAARQRLRREIAFHRFCQGMFLRHWRRLRETARGAGVRLLGDLPIYCSPDSVEVWRHRELFEIDDAGRPSHVAGVPPDDFTADGQTWGSPLYRWARHRDDGFAWWIDRLRGALERVDLLRLDHFRGFEAYWRIPAEAATAAEGEWRPGPGRDLFDALEATLDAPPPLIAEDLGVITPAVEALRDALALPTMRVLQFAFDEPRSPHLPHAIPRSAVVYTGTHDNDTSVGWWHTLEPDTRRRVRTYLGPGPIEQALLRAAYGCRARLAMVPAQDLLGLDGTARMNLPGRADGNWSWRLRPDALDAALAQRLAEQVEVFARGDQDEEDEGEPGERS